MKFFTIAAMQDSQGHTAHRIPVRHRLVSCAAAAALFVLAACAVPAQKQQASDGAEDFFATAAAEDMVFEGLTLLSERYIDPIEVPDLAVKAMQGLASLDPAWAVERSPTDIILKGEGRVLATLPLAEADDAGTWANLTVRAAAVGRSRSEHIGDSSEEQIYQALIDGMVANLDRNSRYAGRDQARIDRSRRDGYGGIGIRFKVTNGQVWVIRVTRNSPAESAGVEVGDIILKVDGVPFPADITTEGARSALRGPIESSVDLTLKRPGQAGTVGVILVRDLIFRPTVKARLDNEILYIQISGFNRHTTESVTKRIREALDEAEDDGETLKGLIIDLQGNPGGVLSQAINLARLFIGEGDIVRTRGRHPGSFQEYAADGGHLQAISELPMVVLVDGKSASASEVLAAALQDHSRAVLVGTSSYGKGTVQTVLKMPNDGELTLTWSRLVAPSGYAWHGLGVRPTVCTSGADTHDQSLDGEELLKAALASQKTMLATLASWRQTRVFDTDLRRELRKTCPAEKHRQGNDIALAKRLLDEPSLYRRFLATTTATAEATN